MKSMLKDTLILMVITLFSGLLLGFVYNVTKDPIARQKELAKIKANQEVFQDATDFKAYDAFSTEEAGKVLTEAGFSGADIDEVSVAMNGDTAVGYVLTVTDHEGYGGDIQFSMGITNDGVLNGISFLSISETAGLGMRADEVLKPQFVNKAVDRFTYVKGRSSEKTEKTDEDGPSTDPEIDAISSATITTNAVTNGVNAGLVYFQTVLEGGNGQ